MSLRVLEPPDHTPRKIVVPEVQDNVDAVSSSRSSDFVMPDDSEILDTIVLENGIYQRVADKLGITQGDVLRCVTRNARALSTRLRSRLMLDTFATLLRIQAALQSALLDMEASDVGRTYAATLAAFSNLANQFPESEQTDTDDDTGAAKQSMIDRIERMNRREQLALAQQQQSETAS